MSTCRRCGAAFGCAMADGNDGSPCWCSAMPPAVPVPATETATEAEAEADLSCWCPACLARHIEQRAMQRAAGDAPA